MVTMDVTTYGFGLGGTWYSPSREYYADVTGMVNWHDVDVAGQNIDAMSYSAGLEVGSRWTGSNKTAFGLMGQLVYTYTDIDDLSAASAVSGSSSIQLDSVDSLEAKGGFLWEYGAGTGTTVQLGAYLTYEFLGETDVSFGNGMTVTNDRGGLNGELSLRAATVVGGGVSLFGEVKGRTELGSDDATSVSGQLGARIPF
jgi:outer membrane autotransporter protein